MIQFALTNSRARLWSCSRVSGRSAAAPCHIVRTNIRKHDLQLSRPQWMDIRFAGIRLANEPSAMHFSLFWRLGRPYLMLLAKRYVNSEYAFDTYRKIFLGSQEHGLRYEFWRWRRPSSIGMQLTHLFQNTIYYTIN